MVHSHRYQPIGSREPMMTKKDRAIGKHRDGGWHTLCESDDDGMSQVFLVSGFNFNPMEPTGFIVNYDKTSKKFLSVETVKPVSYEQDQVGTIN